jgi:hypothetical protein
MEDVAKSRLTGKVIDDMPIPKSAAKNKIAKHTSDAITNKVANKIVNKSIDS